MAVNVPKKKMYAGHTTMRCDPAHIGELKALWRELTSRANQVRGLKGAYFLKDEEKGECIMLGIWESVELSEEFARSEDFAKFLKSSKPLLLEEPERRVFAVAGHWT